MGFFERLFGKAAPPERAAPSASRPVPDTPDALLIMYCSVGDYVQATRQIARGGSVTQRIPELDDVPLVLYTASRGFPHLVRLLVESGADLQAKDSSGRSMADYAAGSPSAAEMLEVVKALEEEGAAVRKELREEPRCTTCFQRLNFHPTLGISLGDQLIVDSAAAYSCRHCGTICCNDCAQEKACTRCGSLEFATAYRTG